MNTYSRTTFDGWEEKGLELPIHSNQYMVNQVKTEAVLRTNKYIGETSSFLPSSV